MRRQVIILFSCITFFQISFLPAQNSDQVNSQIWIDYNHQHKWKNHLFYIGDIGYRRLLSNSPWNMVFVRPSLRFNLRHKQTLRGGIGIFYTFEDFNQNRLELRPWQGYTFQFPFNLRHFIRMEERFFIDGDADNKVFQLRVRYQLSNNIIINNTSIQAKTWYIPLGLEAFFNIPASDNERFANRFRANAGLAYALDKDLRLELIYYLQRSKRTISDGVLSTDNILRLRLKAYFSREKQ